MKTAIVILNYNGKHFLEKFLEGILFHSSHPDVSVIIADNASTDDSISFLQEKHPQVRIIQLTDNHGFAGGYNKALAQIDAQYYVLLNSDVEVSENWIEPVINYLDSNPETAACQPKILAYHNKLRFEYAGAAGGFIDKFGFPFCRGRILGSTEADNGQYDTVEEVFWATGACLFIRSKDFHEIGGFDDSFFAHMEEIDLCWRLKARGRKIVCVPQSAVYHVGGGTLTVESPRKTYLNYRNNLLMLYKNLPESKLTKVFIIRWFLDYIASLQMILTGKIQNARSVWRARKDFNKRKSVYKQKRKTNLELTIIEKPIGFVERSIVWQYYIKKKKKYSML